MIRHKVNSDPAEPLTPAMFQVLLALAGGEMHGYAMLKAVEDQTGGEVRLSTGTLYGMIKRLLVEGVITECRNLPAAKDADPRRRYYALTLHGRQVAISEAERLQKLVQMAESRSLIKRLKPA